jgi:hypothetical protein
MPRAGFEPTTPATERPQTYPLDRAATGIGLYYIIPFKSKYCHSPALKYHNSNDINNDDN